MYRMRSYICVAAAISLGVTSNVGFARPLSTSSGNDLLELCTSENETVSIALCYGFIAGLLSRDRLAGAISKGSQIVCLPDSVTRGQMREVIVAFLRSHPEKRHFDAGGLALEALEAAFGHCALQGL